MASELKTNHAVKLERACNEIFGWHIIAHLEDGERSLFGERMTEVGSKRQLTIWAKRLGMVKDGNVATLA